MVDKQLDETDTQNIGTVGQRVGIRVIEDPVEQTVDDRPSVDKNR